MDTIKLGENIASLTQQDKTALKLWDKCTLVLFGTASLVKHMLPALLGGKWIS